MQPILQQPSAVDFSQAIQAMGDDEELFEEIALHFRDSFGATLAQLDQYFENDARDDLVRCAHGFRGSIGIFYRETPSKILYRLEHDLAQLSKGEVKTLLAELKQEIKKLDHEITSYVASREQ